MKIHKIHPDINYLYRELNSLEIRTCCDDYENKKSDLWKYDWLVDNIAGLENEARRIKVVYEDLILPAIIKEDE